MGVLNCTPDSFYDGGLYQSQGAALKQALKMEAEGAHILDIGGESTRPGSSAVNPDEELKRVIPVIKSIREKSNIPISIDTKKAEVARAALEAGANIVNDVSALRSDPAMASLAADYQIPVILMHMQGEPDNMQVNPVYGEVVEDVIKFLREQVEVALMAGIKKEKIILDPGIGFGKTLEHNLALIKNLSSIVELGFPVLMGASRKSFIGKILGTESPEDCLAGTLAVHQFSLQQGAAILRVHDVRAHRELLNMTDTLYEKKILKALS
jgi:dihydropteroate synthase